MKNILSEIYRGNYTVLNHKDRKDTPFAETLDRMNELEDEIRKALPDGLKSTFEKYVRARIEMEYLACEEDFITGYQLGVRMLLAGLDDNSGQ